MSRYPSLYQWSRVVGKQFPQLSQPMVACLALWSLGMIIARSCALTTVAWTWAPILKQKFGTLRERLRDLYREGPAKAGAHRATLDLSTCWAPWLKWVLQDWTLPQVAVALDATTLGNRFVILVISVLYRGCAVPVAWKILPATAPHAWNPEWKNLLDQFRQVVPASWKVVALADRGLYSKELFAAVVALGWHPLFRINFQGKYRPAGGYRWRQLRRVVARVGHRWQGRCTVFRNPAGQLECTLLACWEQGHDEPWLVVTDLPVAAADVCWYGLRAWIEQGFKQLKSGGWQWQHTRMTDPSRAERLWLAIAVATWWLLSVGGEAEADVPPETLAAVGATQTNRRPQWRLVAVFHRGRTVIMAALLRHHRLPLASGHPEPWPAMLPENLTSQTKKNLQL